MSREDASIAARDHYLARHAAFVPTLGTESGVLASLRAEALAVIREHGLPNRRQEEWRYTNPAPIAAVPFELPASPGAVSREQVEALSFPVFACSLYVFVDGRFDAGLSAPAALSGEVRVESLAAMRAADPESAVDLVGSTVDPKSHPFAALNAAFLDDAAILRVPRGFDAPQPVHVVNVATARSAPTVIHPRLVIEAEPGARVHVIQDHVSLGTGPGFTNAVTEIRVRENAEVSLTLIQREDDARFHVSNLAVVQERDSRFGSHTLTFGGALVRNDATVRLLGEGADCTLDGLFVGSGRQVLDNHTLVDHAVPRCTSRELYKGILGGASRGVFRGRVIVRPDAQKTNALQSNANVLVGDKAEVDTKPQLEIWADDVKCSHGSSIGQLDAEALFYLRARGLAEEDARDLLTRAFALAILEGLPVPGLAEGLDGLLLDRLRRAHHEVSA